MQVSKTALLSRPKTAAAVRTRDVGTVTSSFTQTPPGMMSGEDRGPVDGVEIVDLDAGEEGRGPGVESSAVVAERLKESMALTYHWTTSAQRCAYA